MPISDIGNAIILDNKAKSLYIDKDAFARDFQSIKAPVDKLISLIQAFEAQLGAPKDDNSPVNNKQSLECDEQEQLPVRQIEYIQKWGYSDYLIPQRLGGKLESLQSLFLLVKSIARRDLTLGVALGLPFLAALPIWISGNQKQQAGQAGRLRNQQIGAFALTEKAHGGDITTSDVVATQREDSWILSGEKWCINYGSSSDMVTVLCRTHPKGGPLGFSLFYIEKDKISSGFIPLSKLPTHGVRGLDISGFVLDKLKLSDKALIGEKNNGLQTTLKTLQISRALCTSLSLGASDSALRHAVSFSKKRILYGQIALEISAVKQRLAECFCYQLIADCVSLSVIRGATVVPDSMNLWSSIVKYITPTISEDIVEQCGKVLGARAYLRSEEFAMFQKIRRDNEVVGLFDGSSQVNLFILAGNLVSQIQRRKETHLVDKKMLNQIFNFNEDVPAFSGDGLTCFNHKADILIAGLSQIKDSKIQPMIDKVLAEITAFDRAVCDLDEQGLFDNKGLKAFRYAEKYCWLVAGCCTLQMWYYNQEVLTKELKNTDWQKLAIDLILNKITGQAIVGELNAYEVVSSVLVSLYQEKKSFSVLPITIAD